ncbi:hypothetical protein IWX46DRAFT_406296 [Phyllosticta citricarpa]|uniref:Uncharacterized protein n=1 Tax=Phyllosticta citricarpa TaxID=55181 RepID=A0ABR1L5B1_9PEZI
MHNLPEKSLQTAVQTPDRSRWVKEDGLMQDRLEKVTRSPTVAIGWVCTKEDGYPRALKKFPTLEHDYGSLPKHTVGLYVRLKDDRRSDNELEIFHSWLSIPIPIWDGTANKFDWERLGVLAEWYNPHKLRIYICDATTGIRDTVWDRLQKVDCDEEYLDPHFVHPLILDLVYDLWAKALVAAEDQDFTRTERSVADEDLSMEDFARTTMSNSKFCVRLRAITEAMSRMADAHEDLRESVDACNALDFRRADTTYQNTQIKLAISYEVFKNLEWRCQSHRERVQQHLDEVYCAKRRLQNAWASSKSNKGIPKTSEDSSEKTVSVEDDGSNKDSGQQGKNGKRPQSHKQTSRSFAAGELSDSSSITVTSGEAPDGPLAGKLSTESPAQKPEEDDVEDVRSTQPRSQLSFSNRSPPTWRSKAGSLLDRAKQLSRSNPALLQNQSDQPRLQGSTSKVPSPLGQSDSATSMSPITRELHDFIYGRPAPPPRPKGSPSHQFPPPASTPSCRPFDLPRKPRDKSRLPSTQPRRQDSPSHQHSHGHTRLPRKTLLQAVKELRAKSSSSESGPPGEHSPPRPKSRDKDSRGESKPPSEHSPPPQQPPDPSPRNTSSEPSNSHDTPAPPKNDTANKSRPSPKPYTTVFDTPPKDTRRFPSRIPSGPTSPNFSSPNDEPLMRYPSRVPRNPALKDFKPPPPPLPPAPANQLPSSRLPLPPQQPFSPPSPPLNAGSMELPAFSPLNRSPPLRRGSSKGRSGSLRTPTTTTTMSQRGGTSATTAATATRGRGTGKSNTITGSGIPTPTATPSSRGRGRGGAAASASKNRDNPRGDGEFHYWRDGDIRTGSLGQSPPTLTGREKVRGVGDSGERGPRRDEEVGEEARMI